ncbi:fatty acyl-AMP ligase [Rhizobium skierniewicense]|uniref:fatty acyl-AMP ligase n=1 Tax=Rhizobium skierniewicense TaxID=984260 RepID=UPI001922E766|nr:fatty acyl-AMP ligase [Rhizobium skierniewicense]
MSDRLSESDFGAGRSLSELLLSRAEKLPDVVAFRSAERSKNIVITNSYLFERAAEIAFRLGQVTEVGDRVLLAFREPLDFISAFFGCCLSGTIAVPVVARNEEIMAAIQLDSGAVVGLSAEQRLSPAGMRWIRTDDEEKRAFFRREADANTPVLLQYTSGSTRTPRGVVITKDSLRATISDLDRGAAHNADSVMVSWLPYFHDMGLVYGILTPFYCGFPACLMSPERFVAQPMSWLRAISDFGGTHTAAPNFAYALCADRAGDLAVGSDLSSLRYALNGAEPVRCDTVRRFEAAFARFGLKPSTVVPGYGLAEATLKVTSGQCGEGTISRRYKSDMLMKGRVIPSDGEDNGVELASCGKSLIDTKIAIVDPVKRRLCSADRVGEIWVAGHSVADGYWQRDRETEETFKARLTGSDNQWLRTGDLGFMHDGLLFVTSRLKDLIIIGGRNIYSHDLEDSISACHPAIRMAAFLQLPSRAKLGRASLLAQKFATTVTQPPHTRSPQPFDRFSGIVIRSLRHASSCFGGAGYCGHRAAKFVGLLCEMPCSEESLI